MTSDIAHMIMGRFFEHIANSSEHELMMNIHLWNSVIPDRFKTIVGDVVQKAVSKLEEDYAALSGDVQRQVDDEMIEFYCNQLSGAKQRMTDRAFQVIHLTPIYSDIS